MKEKFEYYRVQHGFLKECYFIDRTYQKMFTYQDIGLPSRILLGVFELHS